jgi:hypothetical protein
VLGADLRAQTGPTARALVFAWPETTATIATEFVYEASRGEVRQQVSQLRMTHRMRFIRHGEGGAVEYSDHQPLESAGDLMNAVRSLLSAWVPRSIVSADGRFLKVEGVSDLRDIVSRIVESDLRMAGQVPAFRQYLEKIATEDGLRQIAADEWNSLVGNWIGLSPTTKRTVSDGKAPVPGGGDVPSKITLAVVDRPRCERAGKPQECLTFEYQTTVDGEQMAAALKAALGTETGFPVPVYMDFERIVRVTLETATMLPHEITITQRSRQERDENGVRVTLRDSTRRVARFAYEPEARN